MEHHDFSTLPISELLGILYAVWAELNRRLGLNHNSYSWNHEQGTAGSASSVTVVPCQEVCEWCGAQCSRRKVGHRHHSCWTHRHNR